MNIDDIKIESPFKDLFSIDEEIFKSIKQDIEEFGYDLSQPIVIWKDKNIIIDGHTRYKAVSELGEYDIPVFEKEFIDKDDALEYAIHNQRDRRNLSDADIIRCINAVDNVKEYGDRKSQEYKNQKLDLIFDSKPSEKTTAEIVGVSQSKVNQVRAVNKDEEIKDEVLSGNITLHKGAQQSREKRKQERQESEKPKFNRTNDSIKWALWTWNPVTGCKHSCKYCYAREIANRFYEHKFKPHFYPKRLDCHNNMKIPSIDEPGEHNVFVSSMGDLFGEWVPDEWIEKVFDSINKSDNWWNYILLTKNPERYLTLDFPEKCWIGATADTQNRMDRTLKVFKKLRKKVDNILFISCEPLLEEIDCELDCIDWLIIGGQSRSGNEPLQPDTNWSKKLICNCYKNNVMVYLKENWLRIQEYPK